MDSRELAHFYVQAINVSLTTLQGNVKYLTTEISNNATKVIEDSLKKLHRLVVEEKVRL